MHILIVHAQIKPEFVDAFIEATRFLLNFSARDFVSAGTGSHPSLFVRSKAYPHCRACPSVKGKSSNRESGRRYK